jgi:23S rRNA (adenine2503-C2)-methyltransferase
VPNRVTISTAGIVPKIREFAALEDRPHLAISLSAASDELRDRLMPINRKWDLNELMKAAREFEKSLRRGERFTFEYVMLGGVNDGDADADSLADLLERYDLRRVKINLIPHNGAEQLDYEASSPEQVLRFKQKLESRGVDAYVRSPRGRDIYAACGQLAAKDEVLKDTSRFRSMAAAESGI